MRFDWNTAYEAVDNHYRMSRAYDDGVRAEARDEVGATMETCDIDPFEEGIRIVTYHKRGAGSSFGSMAAIGHDEIRGGLMALSVAATEQFGPDATRKIARHELAHLVDVRRNGDTYERADHFREIVDELHAPYQPEDLDSVPFSIKEL